MQMALIDTKTIKLLAANKSHLDVEFQVHSRNLTRTNIPGALAEYVEPFARFVDRPSPKIIQRTHENHLQTPGVMNNNNNNIHIKTDKSTHYMSKSGNNIDPDTEMSKISHVAAERRAVSELQKAELNLFSILLRS